MGVNLQILMLVVDLPYGKICLLRSLLVDISPITKYANTLLRILCHGKTKKIIDKKKQNLLWG
jgi:hypothetical protein